MRGKVVGGGIGVRMSEALVAGNAVAAGTLNHGMECADSWFC